MPAIRTFALAAFAAAALAGSAQAQGATPLGNQPVAGRHRGPGGDRVRMFRDLNLTDAQKAQIKTIRARYQGQLKTARDQAKPYMDAARAARQKGDTATARADMLKAREVMQSAAAVRQQEKAEIRAILTPDQAAKFDAQTKKWQGRGGQRAAAAEKHAGDRRPPATSPEVRAPTFLRVKKLRHRKTMPAFFLTPAHYPLGCSKPIFRFWTPHPGQTATQSCEGRIGN